MSKLRSPGQTLIGVAVDEKLLQAIDLKRGGMTRSAFVRQAIGNFLGVSGELLDAPDRTGKGGRPKKTNSAQRAELEPSHDVKLQKKKTKLKAVPGTGTPDGNTKAG